MDDVVGLWLDDLFAFVVGRLEPGDEVVEHVGGDDEGVGVVAAVAFGQAA
ncbi:hypothetical protein ODJ79_28945 [Actinoplanes sp. KI2]|nr:hypothetical protein [Actinoplanes sp. KI2]MCU7727765.1 hypothetical protein [Actinoplanes sp. KI2]